MKFQKVNSILANADIDPKSGNANGLASRFELKNLAQKLARQGRHGEARQALLLAKSAGAGGVQYMDARFYSLGLRSGAEKRLAVEIDQNGDKNGIPTKIELERYLATVFPAPGKAKALYDLAAGIKPKLPGGKAIVPARPR